MHEGPSLFDDDLRPSQAAIGEPAGGSGIGAARAQAHPSITGVGGGGGGAAEARLGHAARAVEAEGDSRGPTLLAVDGDGLAHRAFHAYPSGLTPGPVHGFLALLAALGDRTPADGLLVGFDSRERSVRRERYPAYKGQRDDKDPGLLALLLALPDALEQLGVAVLVVEGWEADDVVASAAAHAEASKWRCTVATSDRDAFCLASARTTVLRLRGGGREPEPITPAGLRRALGVDPERYVEYAALRGDPSDNLEGVRGIGPSRAAALLAAYDHVEAAGADPIGCRSVLGRDVGQALLDDLAAGARSVFRRNVSLMEPRRDLDVDLSAACARPSRGRIAERLEAWGLGHLSGRLTAVFGERPERPPPPDAPLD